MKCRIGNYVSVGQELAVLYCNEESKLADAAANIIQAIKIAEKPVDKPTLVLGTVDSDGVHLGWKGDESAI